MQNKQDFGLSMMDLEEELLDYSKDPHEYFTIFIQEKSQLGENDNGVQMKEAMEGYDDPKFRKKYKPWNEEIKRRSIETCGGLVNFFIIVDDGSIVITQVFTNIPT